MIMGIGVLGPKEAGAKAKAAVDKWEAGKRQAEVAGRRAKPEPAPPATVVAPPAVVVAPALAVPAAPLTAAQVQGLSLQEKNRLLVEAAGNGDAGQAAMLLNAGADANSKDCRGNPALSIALGLSRLEVAKLLIERGADVNLDDANREAIPLIIASRRNWIDIAQLLLRNGADVNKKDSGGMGALDYAVGMYNMQMIELLRKYRATLSPAKQAHVDGQLLGAVMAGDAIAVGNALRYGADHAAHDEKGANALMKASAKGYLEVARVLLDETRLSDAETLAAHLRGEKDLAGALGVNEVDEAGSTALMYAAGGGKLEMTKLLVEKGARIDVMDHSRWNALMLAALNGHAETVKLLVDNKANVDARNGNGNTPLMLAAEKGHLETVQVLVEAGADVNLKDKQGNTALKLAKKDGHDEVVKYLKAHGAKRWFI